MNLLRAALGAHKADFTYWDNVLSNEAAWNAEFGVDQKYRIPLFGTSKTYQRHLRVFHPNGNIYGPFRPANWMELQVYALVPPPIQPEPAPPPPIQYEEDVEFDAAMMEPFDGEEIILENALQPPLEPDPAFKPYKSIHLCQPYLPDQESFRIDSMLKSKLHPFSSEYLRRQYLSNNGLYIKPEEVVTGIDLDVAANPRGTQIRERRNIVAVLCLSTFTNSATLCHPFAGRRAQNLLHAIGEDCLLIELYMDEFTTSCPIGNTASIYKMAGFYIRLLNLPLDMISQLDHIMLACLAHAVDVMDDLQEIIRLILLPQLKKLELDGVTFRYQGTEKDF
uniref:Uncharacterized protein n=1 Tax=Panagrolaimus superbus TaxID=310955 RepID=A0A914XZB5_9BILA